MGTNFSQVASEVQKDLQTITAHLAAIKHIAVVDRDAEWQRVYSLIADLLKDFSMSFAKVARLQGDFEGDELTKLENIGERILDLGGELSEFIRAFYEGKYTMQKETAFGGGTGMGQPPVPGLPPAAPPPEIPVEFEESEPEETEEAEEEYEESEEKQEQQ